MMALWQGGNKKGENTDLTIHSEVDGAPAPWTKTIRGELFFPSSSPWLFFCLLEGGGGGGAAAAMAANKRVSRARDYESQRLYQRGNSTLMGHL